jgi:predicted metal-dependent hydrolase
VSRLLQALGLAKRPKTIEPAQLAIEDKSISVTFRRHAKARRLVLRLSRDRSGVIVTLPPRVGRKEALDFAKRSSQWIAERLTAEPAKRPVEAGATILLRGEHFRIVATGSRRGAVTMQSDTIQISGDAAHIERRLVDWLKVEARRDLVKASEVYATAMDAKFHRIVVRDQKSRWGSCSSDGTLSYSWRLVLAPPFVLDYVAAHEVAHLRHMNHGRQFWRLVLTHCPNAARAKTWLKQHGAELHAYATGK